MSDSYDDYEARMQLAESVREARLSTLNQPNKADTFYLNSEQIIRMAREAGYGEAMSDLHAPALERFAALVAAAERERCCKIVYGQAGSDNVAARTVEAIRSDK